MDSLSSLTVREALELLLTNAIPGRDVDGNAVDLSSRFSPFAGMLHADPAALRSVPGIRENAAAFLSSLPEFGLYFRTRLGKWPRLSFVPGIASAVPLGWSEENYA
ncbi:MAG: hypothetical protein K5746_04550 [Clostridiales bacterium]|nr:hypothetical protein [Clostridiales bacterium]